MGTRFVDVSRETLEGFLVSKHFTRTVQGTEVVYIFSHLLDKNVKIKVYTSLRDGASQARACGKDAIRVVTAFESETKSFGVGKFPKILRTGSEQAVLDRLYARIQEAYLRGSDFIRENNARRRP